MNARCLLSAVLPCWIFALPAVAEDTTCSTCHPAESAQLADSAHAAAQVSCQDCHGGQAAYPAVTAPVLSGAFDHGSGFSGKPGRFDIPEKCAQCHADVARMNPYGLPADQLARYRTSGHGRALYEQKNADAAVCTDCHDVHAIFKASDPRSRVHPVNVPGTCGHCHGDAERMAPYRHPPGIMAEYEHSVHGRGLLEERDTGMPTCATCHGNHAAMPPGVADVNAVCGRCHMQAEQYFLQSPHAAVEAFPRCVGCHGGTHGHAITRLTVTPDRLAEAYSRADRGLDDAALSATLHPGLSLLTESCYECHDEDSDDASDLEALKRSRKLYETVSGAELAYARAATRVSEVGRGILLVEDEELLLGDAKTAAIELSTTQHSLQVDAVQDVAQRLLDTTTQVEASLNGKEEALAWRYQVLWPMWIFIVVFAVASYIRHRQLRAQYVKPSSAAAGGQHG